MVALGVPSVIATASLRIIHLICAAAVICVLLSFTVLATVTAIFARRMEHVDPRQLSCTCSHCPCQCIWCNPLFYDDETRQ
jgi:hypothetical protein